MIFQVLLRIYGRTHGEQALETVLTDTVVFTLLSERQLGPKLHGIFPGGRIEQYIPVRIITATYSMQLLVLGESSGRNSNAIYSRKFKILKNMA